MIIFFDINLRSSRSDNKKGRIYVLSVESLCNSIMRLLRAPVRQYDENGVMTASMGADREADPLACDVSFENLILSKASDDNPVFYVDKGHSLYAIVKGGGKTFVIGPVCCCDSPDVAALQTVENHNINRSVIYKVSEACLENVYECAFMLFSQINDETSPYESKEIDPEIKKLIAQDKKRRSEKPERRGGNIGSGYELEKREQESIKSGDSEELKKCILQDIREPRGNISKSRLRGAKNDAISIVAISSRSAIAGGITPESALALAESYTSKIEDAGSEEEAEAVARTAEFHYASLVKERLAQDRINPIVTASKDYIMKHIYKKISLVEIAKAVDVNASYLSDLFSKHEGKTLTEFVADEKVNFAKRELIYTNDPYDTIASNFSFSSQSHFGRVFKKHTGMTPREFRERYRREEIN